MSVLFDHEIIEQLHDSPRSLVYRARCADGTPLIVKLPNQAFPSFGQLAQFRREYAIARRCGHAGVARPRALQPHRGRWTMILDDIGGVALDKLLRAARERGQAALALDAFFDIALQSCAALGEVHRQGVIHKDINPSNLVWNAERRLLQLIDFGIACELPQEHQAIVHPRALEGTLLYMAPEQTGRMNRRIDYRADFYALGATFYELLTGQPPFEGSDEIALVHCHIARSPDWAHPALAALPRMLVAILGRLLEKDADRRYQSIEALRSDLAACRADLAGPAPAQPRRLSDHNDCFVVPQALHGRERAVGRLLAAFERSADGGREMVLVAGHAGIGKSAVINEVHKPIVASRGWFLAGKFDQFQRHLPYAPLIQACQGLVRHLLCEPEDVLLAWAGRLRDALGSGLGVMVELIPQLALVVGPCDAAPALPPDQAQLRLGLVFPRFLDVFASREHPLTIFLDDLQWADLATLRMVEMLLGAREHGHLLVIGAYRSNEVGAGHPLTGLRDRLGAQGAHVSTMVLGPLSEPQVARIVSAAVRTSAADCAPLTRLCFRKTGGNPFFLNQFLGALHDAGHLRYQPARQCWDWDLGAIEQAAYTDNVVELLLEKIRRLPAATQRVLQLGASVGNRFGLDTLALVLERDAAHTQRILWPALDAGLIQPLDEGYKYIDADADADAGVAYRFLHDRVQQAAYELVDAWARAANHLRIGQLLWRRAEDQGRDDELFDIVEHLNAGRTVLMDAGERRRLAALNLHAGARARRTAAFQATLGYVRTGLELLLPLGPEADAGLWLALRLGEAEAAYLCGDFDAAEAIYPLVRARCETPLEHAGCISVQAHQYQLQGRLADAVAVLREGLALLGIAVPPDAAQQKACFDELGPLVLAAWGHREPEALLEAAEMTDPAAVAALRMMHGLWMASYYAGQQDLSAMMVLSMTRLSMEQGASDFSAVAYVAYAFLLSQQSGDARLGYRFGATAMKMARGRADLQCRIQTAVMFGALTSHWTQPLRSSDAVYDEAMGWALEIGDFVQVGVVAAVRATDRLILGDYLPELMASVQRDLVLMRAHGQQAMADCCVAAAVQPIKCLMGLTARGDCYDDETFDELRFLEEHGHSRLYRAYYLQGRIRNAYLFDGADAEALAGQLGLVTQIMRGQPKVPESSFYAALILIRSLRRGPRRPDAAALLDRIATLQASLDGWAALNPGEFAAKSALVRAELARCQQDLPLATRCYQQAIDAAGLAGYTNIQALASELCGECWSEQGQPRVAAVFIRDAIAHYGQWGAEGKAAQLRAMHGALLARTADRGARSQTGATYGHPTLDLVSLLKATQTLANEVGLRSLLQRLIVIVRENAGAQTARLLLSSDGAYRLEASIEQDQDGDAVTVLQSRQLDLDAAADPQFPLSVLRYVIRSGLEVIEDDIARVARFADDPYVRASRARALLCLPVRHGGRIDGVLYFENRLAAASFTAERVEFLRMLGAHAMTAIASARLHDSLEQRVAERTAALEDANRRLATLSITDGLTGLANRRRFDEVLGAECARTGREAQPLAVLMLDVDHFKNFNDYYGHQAGDACLVQVAQALAAGTRRAGDLAARYGGEEFSIVLPNTGPEEARQVGDALRRGIEALGIAHARAPSGRVTISVGIAVHHGMGVRDPNAMMRVADAALYRAKAGGRNCVVSAPA